jgi:hypothetical protein
MAELQGTVWRTLVSEHSDELIDFSTAEHV